MGWLSDGLIHRIHDEMYVPTEWECDNKPSHQLKTDDSSHAFRMFPNQTAAEEKLHQCVNTETPVAKRRQHVFIVLYEPYSRLSTADLFTIPRQQHKVAGAAASSTGHRPAECQLCWLSVGTLSVCFCARGEQLRLSAARLTDLRAAL